MEKLPFDVFWIRISDECNYACLALLITKNTREVNFRIYKYHISIIHNNFLYLWLRQQAGERPFLLAG